MIEVGPGKGEQQWLAQMRKPHQGQVCFDLSHVLITGAHVSRGERVAKIGTR